MCEPGHPRNILVLPLERGEALRALVGETEATSLESCGKDPGKPGQFYRNACNRGL